MNDPIIDYMKKYKIPIDRKNYLAIDMPQADPNKPLMAEYEAELPEELQIKS
jgi:hypothetical protein